MTALIKSAGQTVVNISATRRLKGSGISTSTLTTAPGDSINEFIKHFPSGGGQYIEFLSKSLGSGFIISQDGYILTNSHVIDQADNIVVSLTDGRKFEASLVGIDRNSDIGLLKISEKYLPAVKIGDPNKLDVGDWVIAIGAPFGLINSVTKGIVSAKGRELPLQNVSALIQTDVAINPGNSGGPLFNLFGEVVGINTEIYSLNGGAMGISFAIPIDAAMRVIEKLRSHGIVQRGRLGVSMQTAGWDIREPLGLEKAGGAIISSLEKGGPAEKAGLRVGDIVLTFDDKEVTTSAGLIRFVSDSAPDYLATLKVWRENSEIYVVVRLGELEADNVSKEIKTEGVASPKYGLDLRELTLTERRKFNTDGAVMVEAVKGNAVLSGIESGDIILMINNRTVLNIKQFRSELINTRNRIVLLVQRDANTKLFISMPAPDVN
jgi:serine protease Do